MIFQEIYNDIVTSFGSLWAFKERGKSLEIITPFIISSQKFVSVFLTMQENEFIISDGGWIDSNIYAVELNFEDDAFSKGFFHFQSIYKIKETDNLQNRRYYYKKALNATSIPSIVFDLANFISSVVSLSEIEFSDLQEKESKARFQKTANLYMLSIFHDKIEFGGHIGVNKEMRFSAIVRKPNNRISVVNYITGSNHGYFYNSITRTNFLFELSLKSNYNDRIDKRISLIDTDASGYIPEKSTYNLNFLKENTHSNVVKWSEKEKIEIYI